jgi:hypothetical protein
MQLDDGRCALYADEKPLGPFETKADACRAGLNEWEKWAVEAAA